MLGQEAAPALSDGSVLGGKTCPQAGRQSLGALLIQPGGFQLSEGTGPPATAQHCAHPALSAVQLCPEAHAIMPKAESPCPLPASSPCTALFFILKISCLPFHSLVLQCVSFISFKEKLYNTDKHSQMCAWCFTVPLSRDTSPAAGPCSQQTRPQLPVSHAVTQTRLISSFTFLLIHR